MAFIVLAHLSNGQTSVSQQPEPASGPEDWPALVQLEYEEVLAELLEPLLGQGRVFSIYKSELRRN